MERLADLSGIVYVLIKIDYYCKLFENYRNIFCLQYNKQLEETQQQHELIRKQKKRQKRFPAEKSEQTEWFQWPGLFYNTI
ncbi:hypothetical protein LOAG_12344 [Loa loa]|uniref:Uncharacterized protein n=1 Tax=Loa loa TaxID=7209 RepID=A0A1I7VNU5_LOALO|nr:hypothetical protein LOAG_12344 [Loa loa]EFO16165.2 hypothetical protein LOAG_12344 [Loa loa]